MSKHTKGQWRVSRGMSKELGEVLCITTEEGDTHAVCVVSTVEGATKADWDTARKIAAAPELLEALEAYRAARAMPSYGDYASIPWESMAGPANPSWHGGDCAKHGRWYGRCHSCAEEWDKLRAQADRDAVHARDNALRAADEKARAAIAKATP